MLGRETLVFEKSRFVECLKINGLPFLQIDEFPHEHFLCRIESSLIESARLLKNTISVALIGSHKNVNCRLVQANLGQQTTFSKKRDVGVTSLKIVNGANHQHLSFVQASILQRTSVVDRRELHVLQKNFFKKDDLVVFQTQLVQGPTLRLVLLLDKLLKLQDLIFSQIHVLEHPSFVKCLEIYETIFSFQNFAEV